MMRFIDGFDHLATADLFGKWTTGTLAAAGGIVASPTRTGAGALQLHGDGVAPDQALVTSPGGSQATLICGWGFRFAVAPPVLVFPLTLGDNGAHYSQTQIGLALNNAGTLSVVRGGTNVHAGSNVNSGGTVLATSALALAVNAWNYLELKVTVHATTGAVDLRVNGVSWIALTNVNTQQTANASANCVVLGGDTQGAATGYRSYFDDLYLADTVAGDVVDCLGPQKIVTVIASSGNGTHTDWTPSTGSDHGALVDEAPPNGDTDYVSDATVGHRDSFHFPALGVTGAVSAVQAVQWAKLAASGARSINSFARIGSTNYDGGTNTALDTTYRAARQLWPASPATAGAWTIAEIDAAEFGVRVQA